MKVLKVCNTLNEELIVLPKNDYYFGGIDYELDYDNEDESVISFIIRSDGYEKIKIHDLYTINFHVKSVKITRLEKHISTNILIPTKYFLNQI